MNSALGGSGPELVHGPSDQIGPFATMQIIRPLEDIFSEAELAKLDKRAAVWYKADKDSSRHLYQIADRFGNHLALVYNKEIVDQPPETMSELIDIAKRHTYVSEDGKKHWGLVWNYTEPYYFIPFLGGFGGWVMNDTQTTPTLNTEGNRRALAFIQRLRDKEKIIPQQADYEVANTLFNEGQAAMIINGDWSWEYYLENGLDIGVARIPFIVDKNAMGPRVTEITLDDGRTVRGRWPTPLVSPRGFSINTNISEEKLEWTVRLVRFLLDDPQQRLVATESGIMPALIDLRDDPVIQDNPIMRGSLRQIEVGRDMPIVPEMRAIWDSMRPHYQGLLGGALSPAEAARLMQEESERKIKEMNEILPPAPYAPALYVLFAALIVFAAYKMRTAAVEFAHDLRKRPFVYGMLLPAFLVIVVVVLYPFLYNIVLSLSNMGLRNFRDWDVVGFQNYAKVFIEPGFYSILVKTIIWTVVNVAFHVTLGVMLALLLNRALPGRGLIRMILILPWAVPQYITALTWRGMFNQEYGAINLILAKYLHLPVVNWLGSPTEAFIACILTNIWLGFPFMMIVALGGLQSIPHQLYEAADIDGASWWTKLTRITIPLLRPVMAPAVVLGMVWTFNNLNVIWLVSNAGEPSDKTHILVSFVYKSAFSLYRYGYAAAMSMVIFLILLTFSVVYMRRVRATEAVY
jgi:arabinogalactan oligomer/maltooligosaccharide transport system permease protein